LCHKKLQIWHWLYIVYRGPIRSIITLQYITSLSLFDFNSPLPTLSENQYIYRKTSMLLNCIHGDAENLPVGHSELNSTKLFKIGKIWAGKHFNNFIFLVVECRSHDFSKQYLWVKLHFLDSYLKYLVYTMNLKRIILFIKYYRRVIHKAKYSIYIHNYFGWTLLLFF
jgi:hypothetical protein